MAKLKGVRAIGELVEEARKNGSAVTTASGKKPPKQEKEKSAVAKAAESRVDKRVERAVEKKLAGKQKELPGMETKRDKKMDEYVATYLAIAAEHAATWSKLGEVKANALEYMREKNITKYPIDDEFDLAIEPTEFKLKKVRRASPGDDSVDEKDVPKKSKE